MRRACLTLASSSQAELSRSPSNEGSRLPLRHIRRCVAAALALGVFAFPSSGFARDGIGRMAPQPGRVVAGSAGNTLTFTFTADSASVRGQTLFAVPNGWTAPQTTDPAGPGYLRIGRRGCAGAT